MIISPSKKFVFIHIPKTAGTSISLLLSRFCNVPPDVITEYKDITHDAAKTFQFNNIFKGKKITKHMKFVDLKRFMSKELKEFFTFTFERNPWDKAISRFLYAKKTNYLTKNKIKNFKEFLLHPTMKSNWNFYGDSKNVLVDFVGKYETLNQDLMKISQRLNLPIPKDLPHEKKNQTRKHYSYYYTSETKNIVYKQFSREIKFFNYTFEDKT